MSKRGGLRMADNLLKPLGLGVLDAANPAPAGCRLLVPKISRDFLSDSGELDIGDTLSSLVMAYARVGTVSEDDVDGSIRPVPPARGEETIGHTISPGVLLGFLDMGNIFDDAVADIGHIVSLSVFGDVGPTLPRIFPELGSKASILSSFDPCCG